MKQNTDLYRVVRKMVASGNQPGVITLWKNMVGRWAEQTNSPDAEAVKAWLPAWQDRPFYTAAELAPLMPALMIALGVKTFSGRLPPVMGAARLANELKAAGLPFHRVENTDYFVVERLHKRDEMIPEIERHHYAPLNG